jgi:hypothetical protein
MKKKLEKNAEENLQQFSHKKQEEDPPQTLEILIIYFTM